ncbi:MAG: hypothetical protein WA977_08650 [Halobacteriota archaeon]
MKRGYEIKEIEDFDGELIEQRINPGSAADIISAYRKKKVSCRRSRKHKDEMVLRYLG